MEDFLEVFELRFWIVELEVLLFRGLEAETDVLVLRLRRFFGM